jgi:hypothetical protein
MSNRKEAGSIYPIIKVSTTTLVPKVAQAAELVLGTAARVSVQQSSSRALLLAANHIRLSKP